MIILESKRLLFRQHKLLDLESYCAMEMDAEVRRFVGGYPRSRGDAEHKFRHSLSEPPLDRLCVWATILKPAGPYVGRCGLYPHLGPGGKVVPAEAVLSFYIARAFWNQGLASEAAEAFVGFGWKDLHLSRIVATVEEGNSASVRILQKLGFNLIQTEPGLRTLLKFALINPNSNQHY
ncbi:MAG: GNAT family N-acetyltransferase [Acidobacteriaceae bacterium]|nr:GNAT family N-acetyltransferase [Acidobacteriaceae bacterium]